MVGDAITEILSAFMPGRCYPWQYARAAGVLECRPQSCVRVRKNIRLSATQLNDRWVFDITEGFSSAGNKLTGFSIKIDIGPTQTINLANFRLPTMAAGFDGRCHCGLMGL